VLLRGPSGSGKSTLALALVDAATRRGLFARLVADDRVVLRVRHDRLVARPHPRLAGLVEERFVGLVGVPFLEAAVIRLVVDLDAAPERLPEPGKVDLRGVTVPAMMLSPGRADPETILRRLRAGAGAPVAAPPRPCDNPGAC
jgi:HPr kinase/phosphorylase